MKIRILLLMFALTLITASANENPNKDGVQKRINLGQVNPSKPHITVDDPIAMYNTVTGTLTITLDATYYSDYVITIEGDYASMDYYVTSPVVVFPASSLSEVSYIYIDSDDCGTYEGVLDINSFGNTY